MSVDLEKFRTCVAISDDELVLEMAPDVIAEVELLRSEIARLRDELTSATRHMELAEAAWLRETAGNSPISSMSKQAWQLVHDNERLRDEIARLRLTEVERECLLALRESDQVLLPRGEKVIAGLLERHGLERPTKKGT